MLSIFLLVHDNKFFPAVREPRKACIDINKLSISPFYANNSDLCLSNFLDNC